MTKHALILPTYNERPNIAALIEVIFRTVPHDLSILVVDDNSPDGTGEVVRELATRYPRLSLLHREKKEGLGPAHLAGFAYVLAHPSYVTVTMMDADFSHNPRYLPEMLKQAGSHDLVVGSRYVRGGGVSSEWGVPRKILSRLGNWYINFWYHYPLRDWTGGYNTIRTDALRRASIEKLDPKGYSFVPALKYALLKTGSSFLETPIHFEERRAGTSKVSLGIALESLKTPLRVRAAYRKNIKTFPVKDE